MKLPIFGRRNSEPDSEPEPPEVSIDISTPRESIYQRFEDHPGPCPQCGGSLHQCYQTYFVATRRGRRMADSFFIGNDMGWFCTRCPTVVISPQQVSEFLQHSLPDWDVGAEFRVVGIVDLDAIPPEQRHLPLDEIDPFPLVSFNDTSVQAELSRSARPGKKSRLRRKPGKTRKKKKKRRR